LKQYKLLISLAMIMELVAAPRIDNQPILLPEQQFSAITITNELQTKNLKVSNTAEMATANILNLIVTGTANLGSGGSVTLTNLTVTGTLSTQNTITAPSLSIADDATVGCDLTVGCNILMQDSTSVVGTIYKGSLPFATNPGNSNAFYGVNAGNFSVIGGNNTGIGVLALNSLTTGSDNVAVGNNALQSCTIGAQNVAIGYQAGSTATDCVGNVLIGYNAGSGLTEVDSYNIYIGANQVGQSGDSGICSIGSLSSEGVSMTTATYIAGIAGAEITGSFGTTDLPVYINLTSNQLGTMTSSKRFKENITPLSQTDADAFMKLQPVEFTRKSDSGGRRQYGLIAEDVEKLMPELVAYDKDGEIYSLQYHLMYALLLKSIQDNRALIEQLQIKSEHFETIQTQKKDQKKEIEQLKELVTKLTARVELLAKK
jgi:trimeric autotransporter adhesin